MSPTNPQSAQRPYNPHGAAEALLYDRRGEVVLSGPAGTGKSRACLEKLLLCCLKYAGTRALIVRKTRESLTESALVTFETKVVPEGWSLLEGPQRRLRQAYHFPNGSEVVIGGLDKPSKVMSTEYDLIYVQEAIELFENDWESLTTRLRNGVMPYQQLMADTNPDAPTHWLKKRADRGATVMLESRHEDNPTVTPAYLATLDALSGVRLQRLRYGRWVSAEGMVYDGFDRAVNLVDQFEIPRSWLRLRSIDFGYTNPFVCQWWAVDPDGRMYLYREIYRTRQLLADLCQQINALSAGESIEFSVADTDAGGRATLHAAGITTRLALKAVSPGIQAVQDRIRNAGDGKPRLYILRDALVERDKVLDEAKKPCATIEELDGYIWSRTEDGQAACEEPMKLNDHGMDAMRYAAMAINRWLNSSSFSPDLSLWPA
jgi:phage terminase large subunit